MGFLSAPSCNGIFKHCGRETPQTCATLLRSQVCLCFRGLACIALRFQLSIVFKDTRPSGQTLSSCSADPRGFCCGFVSLVYWFVLYHCESIDVNTFTLFYRLNVFCPNSYVEIQSLEGMVLGSGPFGR